MTPDPEKVSEALEQVEQDGGGDYLYGHILAKAYREQTAALSAKEKEVGRLKYALEHQKYRQHEYSKACSACNWTEEALTGAGES